MSLPQVCRCLDGERLCFRWGPSCCPYYDKFIPVLISGAVAIITIGCLGWVWGTAFPSIPVAGVLHVPSMTGDSPFAFHLGVALNGAVTILSVPASWAMIWCFIVRPPGSPDESYTTYRLRCDVRKCPILGPKFHKAFEESALSNQFNTSQQSNWAPLQVLNRYVLQPLSKNNQDEVWRRLQTLLHFY